MAKKYLDYDGLLYFWQKIKTYFTGTATPKMNGTAAVGTATKFSREDHVHPSDTSKVDKVSGKGLSTNDFTTTLKNKLDGIAAGAEVNQNAFGKIGIGDSTISAEAKVDTLKLATSGLITLTPDTENNKLTIGTTAEVNQNAFGNVKVGSTTIAADSKTDTLTLVGSGSVTLTPDATNDKVTISSTGEANQNAFTKVTFDDTEISSSSTTDTLYIYAGANVDLEPDATNKRAYINVSAFGTCSTAAGTEAKAATTTNGGIKKPGSSTEYRTGTMVAIKFTVTNTAAVANLTLAVDGGDAYAIKYRGGNLPSAGTLAANRLYVFIFTGTYWEVVGDIDTNTTYSQASLGQGYGTCGTAEGTAAKVVTLASYTLATNGIVAVKFTNAVCANATMNINSKGAKAIKANYNGALANIKAGTIGAGDIATFIYNGTDYILLSVYKVYTDFKGVTKTFSPYSSTAGTSGLVPAPPTGDRDYTRILTDEATWTKLALSMEMHSVNGGDVATSIVLRPMDESGTADSNRMLATMSVDQTVASANNPGFMSAADKTKLDKLLFDTSNKIDSSILPSYVDDVIEAYARSGQTALSSTWLATGSASGTVITPEKGKIYVLMADSGDYSANTQFRWSGSAYVKLNDGGVSSITNSEIDTIIAT